MNKNRIEHGDKVEILFNNLRRLTGVVDYIPVSAGDSWILISEETQAVHYIQQFDQMRLIQKKDER